VWDFQIRYRKVAELRGHTRGVLCLTSNGTILVSAASDNSLRIWSLDDLKCIAVIKGHIGDIYSMEIEQQYLYIGCQDTSIKVG
jgi:WD40 repeat protein